MTAHSIRVDQLDHSRFFERLLANLIARKKERIAIQVPAERRMRESQIQKDVPVKVVLADEEVVYAREKRSRLRALNDAMIVSAADRDALADAEL